MATAAQVARVEAINRRPNTDIMIQMGRSGAERDLICKIPIFTVYDSRKQKFDKKYVTSLLRNYSLWGENGN